MFNYIAMNALLVIDVQNDYFPGGAWPQFAAAAVGVRIAAAIRAAEVAGWCIITLQHINDADAPLLAAGSRGPPGTRLWRICYRTSRW